MRWEPIPSTGGLYEASDEGQIRRAGHTTPRVLYLHDQGYFYVTLSVNGRVVDKTVHGFVAEAFLGPRPKRMQVNHRDGVKTNNAVWNLEYVTPKQNAAHASAIGLLPVGSQHWMRHKPHLIARGDANGSRKHPEKVPRGSRHYIAKLTEAQVGEIRRRYAAREAVQTRLAAEYGVCQPIISCIVRRKTWKHVKEGASV